MNLARKTWNKYIKALSAINDKASNEMLAFIEKGGGYENIPVDRVIDYGYALATKYGEASGALSAEMYDAIAELSKANVPPAVPADTATYHDVAKAVQGSAKFSTNEAYIAEVIGRLVKQTGADTTLQNALRDGAQFAWVPSGDTCMFCITLASRGWQTASKDAIKNGHAEHIHSNCDCTYAIRFNESTQVRGYDPAKYLAMYQSADGATGKDKINAMRREAYQINKDKINAQKRSNYAKMKARESSKAEELNVD